MTDAMGVEEQEGEDHREISVAEFFEKNKHLLGFENPQKSIITVVKEAVDNSLDACEQDDIIPEVQVLIDEVGNQKCRVELRDNAIGMDADTVPKVFGKLLYGSKFHKLQQSLLPDQKILVEKDGEVQLVEIGNLCDSQIRDMDGEKTVELEEEVKAPCFDRDTGEINWSPVTHAIRHRNRHDAYRIESSRGREIEVTANHSLFSVEDGEKVEVEAEQLSEGDNILAPQRIPSAGQKQNINVLSQFKAEEVEELGWYVYGIEQEKLFDIKQKGQKIRKKPSPDSRKRTYYRYNGVDILKDSLETNYLDGGYLPAEKAMRIGWKGLEDLKIRTYQVGGDSTEIPARIDLDEDFMRFLGLFAAEGHAGERQAAFTFGSHEQELVEEVSETATSKLGAGTTTVERESNSTRVKVFGSPLVKLVEKLCGTGARQKHVPSLLFETTERNQKAFLKGLIAGDGSDAHPSNQVNLTSTSRRMAQEVSYLFNMLGVVSSWKQRTTDSNISGGTTTTYDVLIHGNDIEELGFESSAERENRYRMLPADLVEDLRVDDVDASRVQPTRAGIYYAAGIGSSPAYTEKYINKIEELKNSEHMEDDRYVRNLREKGLVEGYSVTDRMRSIEKRADKLLEFADSDLCLLPAENIEKIESPEYVYDISVPGTGEDENFVAGNQGAICVKNSRGQQGIGISASAMYAQLTTGEPVTVYSKEEGEPCNRFVVRMDTEANEPEIIEQEEVDPEGDEFPGDQDYYFDHGTSIEMTVEAKYTRGHHSVKNYLKHTAIMNPYARIVLREPDGNKIEYPRVANELPEKPREIKPHLHGVELGVVMRMIENSDARTVSSFLQQEFTRVGRKSAVNICEEAEIDDGRRPNTLEKDEVETLLNAADRTNLQNPPTDCLSPAGEDLLLKGLEKELNPEFTTAVTRKPSVYGGNPFQVECTVADTEIVLEDGETVEIQDYVEGEINKRVLGLTDSGSVEPVDVEAKMRIPRDHDIYEVETQSGRSLKVTGNNELPVQRDGRIEWTRADELDGSERLATPREFNTRDSGFDPLNLMPSEETQVIDREVVKEVTEKMRERYGTLKDAADRTSIDYDRFKAFRREKYTTRPYLEEFREMLAHCQASLDQYREEIDSFALVQGDMNNPNRIQIPVLSPELGRFLGMVESDGHISEYTVGFTNTEEKLLNEFATLAEDLLGVETDRQEDYVRIDSKSASHLLSKLKQRITSAPQPVLRSWVAGFLDGDGCLSKRSNGEFKQLRFCTAEKERAEKVRNILLQMNIRSSVRGSGKGQVSDLNGREIITQKQRFDVSIESLNQAQKLLENLELRHPDKEERRKDILAEDKKTQSKDLLHIGRRLKHLREEAGLTQSELGLSANSVRRHEQGKASMRRENLRQVYQKLPEDEEVEMLLNGGIRSETIKSIGKVDTEEKYVYDLQTSAGNFVAENMLMHNCGLAWGGDIADEGSFEELRYANKVPLLYKKSSCVTTKAIEEVDWSRYNISQSGSRPQGPLYISIHIASVWVPFTSEGKEAVANYDDIRKEMKLALQEAGRKLGRYIKRQERKEIQEEKKRKLTSYATEMGDAIAKLAGDGDSEEYEAEIKRMVQKDYDPEGLK